MTDTPTQRSHHWFLFLLGVVGVAVIAYLTYTGLLLFREYQKESLRTQQEQTVPVDTPVTVTNEASEQDAALVDRTEPLPTIANGWSTVAGQQRVRGTVIAVNDTVLRIIIDDTNSYPEADVEYTTSTTVEHVDTTAFDAQGQPVRTTTSATAISVGDVIDVDTIEPIAADATTVTSSAIIRYQ